MTPVDFKNAFPVFSDEDDATIQRHLDESVSFFDVDRWGGFYLKGLGNWVAHEIVMEDFLGATPATAGMSLDATGKTVGRMSARYSDKMAELKAKNPYMRTVYGQVYYNLAVKYVGIGGTAA